ncbi:MAG: SLBB domain-containing protein [Myxococcales bacterium]|nr:SLBB domain-containing protein [Myxococcales bacterium]
MASVACGYPRPPAHPAAEVGEKKGAEDEGFEAAQVERPGMPSDAPHGFALAPGDTLAVELVSTETQNIEGLMLDGKGMIHLPLVGDVAVGGASLSEVEQVLTQAFHRFDRLAQVRVRLTGRGGQRATVLGAVEKQGPVELHPAARLTDLIAAAGGPLSTVTGPDPVTVADVSGAVVMRDGKALPVDMQRAMLGDPKHNIYVRPGDHVYVPPSRGMNITVLGQVGNPQLFVHREGLRLTQVLALAGGVTTGGDKDDIRVIRGTLLKPKVYTASLRDVVDGNSHDVVLQPGDIIFVTDHFIEDFSEVMAAITPALSLGLTSAALAITIQR